jgi:hypothetical protein
MRLRAMPFRIVDGCQYGDHARQERRDRIGDARCVTEPRHDQISVRFRTVTDERDVVGHQAGSGIRDSGSGVGEHGIEQRLWIGHDRIPHLTPILEQRGVHVAAPCVHPRRYARPEKRGRCNRTQRSQP